MQADLFSPAAPGRLVRAMDDEGPDGQKRQTFLPDPLYPELKISAALRRSIEAAICQLGRLDGMTQLLPDRTILLRSFVRREAQLSSYIENTYARFDEVAAAERNPGGSDLSQQVIETFNAEQAITEGIAAVTEQHQPVTNGLVRRLHQTLLAHDARGHESRGQFRRRQVYIGNEVLGPDGARFVPPAWHLVPEAMDGFERAWEQGDAHFAVVRLAMLHYQFEAIHPFEDGNGRLGRILTLLGLCTAGLLTVPVLNASLHFERNRRAYYDGLLRVSTDGDWAGWVAFFVDGIRVAAVESTRKLEELLGLQRQYYALTRTARNSALLLTLIDHLFISPTVTVPEAAEVMGVTRAAAGQSVQKLVDAGILRVRRPGRPTIYVADTVLRAVNAEPTRR